MRKKTDSMVTHNITKCITTRYDDTKTVFTVISRKGKDNVIILNGDSSEELLREQLIRLGYDAAEILAVGIRLPKDKTVKFRFEVEGSITTQTEERMIVPYHKGDIVRLHRDGSFETVPESLSRWERLKKIITTQWKELKEDTITAIAECNNNLTRLAEELEQQLP